MWRITPTSLCFRNVGGTQQQREVRDYKTRSDLTTPWLSREELLPALPWLSTRSVMLVCCCCAHKWNHTMRLSHKRSSWFFARVCVCWRLLSDEAMICDDSETGMSQRNSLQQVFIYHLTQIIVQVLQPTHKQSEAILVSLGTRWQAEEDKQQTDKLT